MARQVFVTQKTLDQWLEAGQAEVAEQWLSLNDGRRFRLLGKQR